MKGMYLKIKKIIHWKFYIELYKKLIKIFLKNKFYFHHDTFFSHYAHNNWKIMLDKSL
jgi:hypothetical protein